MRAVGTQSGLLEAVRPFLHQLAGETGHEAHLGVLEEGVVVLVDTAAPASPVSVRSMVGMSEPLHCTALGKAILAFLPEDERDRLITALPLEAMTPNAVTDPSHIVRHLADTRAQGIATDYGEHIDILSCFAAPVLDRDDHPVVAIGVSMIGRPKSEAADKAVRDTVLKAAKAVAASIQSS